MSQDDKSKSRARITLSCAQCKRRKVKCDRKLPCSSCVKHNVPESCGYFGDQVVAQKPAAAGGVSVFRAFSDDSARVFRFEKSVKTEREMDQNNGKKHSSFVPQHAGPAAKRTPDEDPEHMSDELQRLKSKLRHLEASFQRAPSNGSLAGASPGIAGYSATALPPPASIYPPAAPSLSAPASYMPQMGPLYGSNGSFVNTPQPPSLVSVPAAGFQNLQTTPSSTMSPTGSYTSHTPRSYYSNNSSQLGTANGQGHYGRLNDPPVGPPRGMPPWQETVSIPSYASAFSGKGNPPQTALKGVPATSNVNYPNHSPMPFIPPISVRSEAGTPGSCGDVFPQITSNETWVGVNPHDTSALGDLFDLFSGYNPIHTGLKGRTMNHGPFSWFSYVQKDPALKSLWDYTRKPHEKADFQKVPSLQDVEEDPPQSKDAVISPELKAELNKRTLSLGLTVFEGEVDSNMHLIERIRLMLPTWRAVSILVDRYFKAIYPYFPLLDEAYFRREIQRILGPFSASDEKYDELHMSKRYDMATMGILLLVLRISYLSAFSNSKCENEQVISGAPSAGLEETRYILTNPINIDVVPIVQLCLDRYNLYQRTNLTALQCAILFRAYCSIAPEEGDSADGYESDVFNVMCIQTAYCMGLNREPRNIHNHSINPSRDHLSRKLWFFIKLMDMKSSYHFGFPLMVDETYNDVEPPVFAPGNANVADECVEMKVCNALGLIGDLYTQMRVILKSCVSIKDPMKVWALTESMTRIETQTSAKLGSLSQLLSPATNDPGHSYVKVLRTKTYLNIKSFNLSIFYHLFLNYERAHKHDLGFFYLRKFFSISCGEFLVEASNMIKNPALFDPESVVPGLILNPPIVSLIHKSNQVNLRLAISLFYKMSVMESDPEHTVKMRTLLEYQAQYNRVSRLAKLMENLTKFSNSCFTRLSHRFFYAWRLAKVHTFLIEVATSKSFREYHLEKGMDMLELTPDRIEDLLNIAEKAYSSIKKSCLNEVQGGSNGSSTQTVKKERDVILASEKTTDVRPQGSSVNSSPGQASNGRRSKDSLASRGHYSDMSSSSTSTFDFADLDLGNSEEIDSLWQQINSIKNNQRGDCDENSNGGLPNDGERVDGDGDWYQRLFAVMPQHEAFGHAEGNGPFDDFSHLPM